MKKTKVPDGHIEVTFLQPWQQFAIGDTANLGKGQATTLKERGIIECDISTKKPLADMVNVRLLQPWGGKEAGDKVKLDRSFANELVSRVIELSNGNKVKIARLLA